VLEVKFLQQLHSGTRWRENEAAKLRNKQTNNKQNGC